MKRGPFPSCDRRFLPPPLKVLNFFTKRFDMNTVTTNEDFTQVQPTRLSKGGPL